MKRINSSKVLLSLLLIGLVAVVGVNAVYDGSVDCSRFLTIMGRRVCAEHHLTPVFEEISVDLNRQEGMLNSQSGTIQHIRNNMGSGGISKWTISRFLTGNKTYLDYNENITNFYVPVQKYLDDIETLNQRIDKLESMLLDKPVWEIRVNRIGHITKEGNCTYMPKTMYSEATRVCFIGE